MRYSESGHTLRAAAHDDGNRSRAQERDNSEVEDLRARFSDSGGSSAVQDSAHLHALAQQVVQPARHLRIA